MTCCTPGYSATIRNPEDLDELIDLDHEYLTYDSYHNNEDVIDTVQYYFRSDKGDNFKPLKRNSAIDLNSPLCYVDSASSKTICEQGQEKKTNFYRDDDNTVAMAITSENGTMKLKGIVHADNVVREYDPLEDRDLPNNRYHVIRKRWTANMVRKPINPYQPYQKEPPTPYKKLPDWVSDKTDYCIDVLCVVDYSIYKKFKATEKTDKKAMEKIRYYYAHVINGINMRYSTIAQKDLSINVRLAGYFIAKNPNDLPFIDAKKMAEEVGYRVNSNYTLTELDSFLKGKQQGKRNVLPDFNHAMLFLEYAATNLGGSVLGTSFVSGICSDSRSTSLVVDHGAYTSAGIGTHELGHNLGVYWHDGEGTARKTSCSAKRNYIMAPASYLIDEKNLRYSFTFSPCSTKQIKTHIDTLIKLNRNCLQCNLRDKKSNSEMKMDKEVDKHMEVLPGEIDDVHIQCRQLYGEGSFMCPPKSPEEMCYRMYCYDPTRSACAIISEQMAATGTPCGKFKICKMGKCVQDIKGKDVPDDCPYPDIPSYGAHCEDATPFMCKNDKFREKCCNSCNKQFSAEEACKDSHILINNMTCSELMESVFGRPGCASDHNVQNMCCLSCKRLLGTGGQRQGGIMIHVGIGSQMGPAVPSFGQRFQQRFGTSGGFRSNAISNKISGSQTRILSSKARQQQQQQQARYKVPSPQKSKESSSPPPGCTDDPAVTFNKKTCPDIGKNFSYFCKSEDVQRVCCKSCWPHRLKYNKG